MDSMPITLYWLAVICSAIIGFGTGYFARYYQVKERDEERAKLKAELKAEFQQQQPPTDSPS
jgi:hypothetical protein